MRVWIECLEEEKIHQDSHQVKSEEEVRQKLLEKAEEWKMIWEECLEQVQKAMLKNTSLQEKIETVIEKMNPIVDSFIQTNKIIEQLIQEEKEITKEK